MNESVEVKIARIEETTIHTKEAVGRIEASLPPLARQVENNKLDIALMKRDAKWRSAIVIAIGGIFGSIAGIAAEFLRHYWA